MLDRHQDRRRRVALNRKDLTNHRFGKLVALSATEKKLHRRPKWICICDCGTKVEINGKYLLNGDTKSCGCLRNKNVHNKDTVGEITKSYWTHILGAAKQRGIPVEISREFAWTLYLNQNRRCAISNQPITFVSNYRDNYKSQTASLDRKDCTKSYTEDNVQWVHKTVNLMKCTLQQDEFINWCKIITENQNDKTSYYSS